MTCFTLKKSIGVIFNPTLSNRNRMLLTYFTFSNIHIEKNKKKQVKIGFLWHILSNLTYPKYYFKIQSMGTLRRYCTSFLLYWGLETHFGLVIAGHPSLEQAHLECSAVTSSWLVVIVWGRAVLNNYSTYHSFSITWLLYVFLASNWKL